MTAGGGERHLADLTSGLLARGHELFAAVRPGSALSAELSTLLPGRITSLPLRNALDIISAVKLARYAKAKNIDVIHAHVARDYQVAALASRISGAHCVLTRHVLFPANRANGLALGNVSRVIAVSAAVANAVRASRLVSDEKIAIVPNGVDFARLDNELRDFSRLDYRLRWPGRMVVGMMGELSEVKGQADFIRAASIVVGNNGGNITFVIAGEDKSPGRDYRAQLEGLIAESSLSGIVQMPGRIARAGEFYRSLDVFVSASRSEAFGLAMVEAMACGTAVVATNTQGTSEIIEHGATGILVPVGDSSMMAAAIQNLLSDNDLRRALGDAGSAAVRARYDVTRMVSETEKIYEDVLREAGLN
jgi:glycosyltransferase involved in cell wall biosynthesis